MRLGQTVFLNGPIITGRDEVHMRALAGGDAPDCLKGAALYHCGPIMAKDGNGWKVIAAGPTTSARMNSMAPEMIRRFGIRAVIGKGGMSDEVLEAMKEVGCVYLAAIGGAAVSLAECIRNVKGAEWHDLGMAEAMWKFETERFGPLTVAMDAKGNSLYKEVKLKADMILNDHS